MRDAIPCRADRPGDRTAAAGAHAARRRGRPSLGRGSEVGRQRVRDADAAGGAPRAYCSCASHAATHLLSNGRYAVMLTAAGSGYSRWRDLAVTRWREDATCDDWGSYIFLRDVRSGEVWSAGYQPSGVEPDSYEVTFTEDRAEFIRRDGIAARRRWKSWSRRKTTRRCAGCRSPIPAAGPREIEITSYAELVLAPQAADIAHPAFSKLFVETEYLTPSSAPSWRRGGGGRRPSRGLGGASCGRRGRDASASRSSRPIARASSAAAAASARRSR